MKLTNYIRDAFIRSAMHDVPMVDYDEQAHKIAHKALADLFKKEFPGIDFEKAKASGWLDKVGVRLPGDIPNPYTAAPHHDCLKGLAIWPKLEALATSKKEQDQQRNKLEAHLRGAAYGCNTRKALAELLPEFARYLPEEEATTPRNLPAVTNLVTDFMKAGWPKDKKKAA